MVIFRLNKKVYFNGPGGELGKVITPSLGSFFLRSRFTSVRDLQVSRIRRRLVVGGSDVWLIVENPIPLNGKERGRPCGPFCISWDLWSPFMEPLGIKWVRSNQRGFVEDETSKLIGFLPEGEYWSSWEGLKICYRRDKSLNIKRGHLSEVKTVFFICTHTF